MLKIGEIQSLRIIKITSEGALLESQSNSESVMMAANLVPLDKNPGDFLEVFIFTDNYGKPVATFKKPKLFVGEIGLLKVLEYNDKGAFLDWEFIVDIFAPRDNINCQLIKGNHYLFRLYVNDKKRIRASMEIYGFLSANSPYNKNDQVSGVIYKKLDQGGYLVAVDSKYYGLIPAKECFKSLEYGETIEARVIRVRDDGKLDISPRQVAHIQLDIDAEMILEKIKKNGGEIKLTDHSTPEEIKKRLNLSKKAFKRAIGRLLKNGSVTQGPNSIKYKK